MKISMEVVRGPRWKHMHRQVAREKQFMRTAILGYIAAGRAFVPAEAELVESQPYFYIIVHSLCGPIVP